MGIFIVSSAEVPVYSTGITTNIGIFARFYVGTFTNHMEYPDTCWGNLEIRQKASIVFALVF